MRPDTHPLGILLLTLALASVLLCEGCVSASSDGTRWRMTSVATDLDGLEIRKDGMKAARINQSVSTAALLKTIKGAWSNYLLAEGLKWAAGKYYDHQGAIISGTKELDLEKLRNAKSAADSAAALERLKAEAALIPAPAAP